MLKIYTHTRSDLEPFNKPTASCSLTMAHKTEYKAQVLA